MMSAWYQIPNFRIIVTDLGGTECVTTVGELVSFDVRGNADRVGIFEGALRRECVLLRHLD